MRIISLALPTSQIVDLLYVFSTVRESWTIPNNEKGLEIVQVLKKRSSKGKRKFKIKKTKTDINIWRTK